MIGGSRCTRRCAFCDVTTGRPDALDPQEPARVAEAVATLGLRFAVVTCVARDDLRGRRRRPDGRHGARDPRALPGRRRRGADRGLRRRRGRAARRCSTRGPDVLNHNLETVERLQRKVRPAASYERSLFVLRRAGELSAGGARQEWVDPRHGRARRGDRTRAARSACAGVTLLTLGQYLRPSPDHLPLDRWVTPAEFAGWAKRARALGFRDVASGPLVRSSYHAERLAGA